MYRNPPLPSLLRRISLSFLLGFGLFALGGILQLLLDRYNVRGPIAFADNALVGVVSGLLVFVYEQRRYNTMLQRVKVIAAMNHHVRNALQAITFSPYAANARQLELIQTAAGRIQWALDEILPGSPPPDADLEGPLAT